MSAVFKQRQNLLVLKRRVHESLTLTSTTSPDNFSQCTHDQVVYREVLALLWLLCRDSHQILSLQKLFFCVESFSLCYLSAKFHHSHSIEKKLCDNIFIYAMKYVSSGCAEQQVVRLGAKNIWLRETKHQSP